MKILKLYFSFFMILLQCNIPAFAVDELQHRNMFLIPEWPEHGAVWRNETLDEFLHDLNSEDINNVTLLTIQDNSEKFPIKFPIESIRCKHLSQSISKDYLEKNINSVYPVLHENALSLYSSFLNYKRRLGSAIERNFYENMTLIQLVDRLLEKRAVLFVGEADNYILLDGTIGFGKWETIGKDTEGEQLNLKKCLSYDEIKLSALLSVSSYTHFINDGNRYNQGVPSKSNVEPEGIIIGLIGARFEKPKVMEYQEIVITPDQNNEGNGYGTQFAPTMRSIVSGFYGEICLTYRQAMDMYNMEQTNRFNKLNTGALFDNNVFCKRITLSIDTLLLEANERAKEVNTTAFVHVVGIGLGVWKLSSHQNALFLDTFAKRIELLGKSLYFVSDVVFSHFGQNKTSGGYKNGDIISIPDHPKGGIKVLLENREPHVKLTGTDEGKLLVVSYAWDGNALPGNEFWQGSLSASGDPAAASSTQIAELHNPHINPKVCGKNLRIATRNGVVPLRKYYEIAERIN